MPIGSQPADVPSFGCIVYLSKSGSGVRGRVANLEGIEVDGSDDRSVLGEVVKQFRRAISEGIASENGFHLIEPPMPKQPGERKVFLPVHL